VRRTAWGYTLQADGKQVRKFSATWTKEDAQAALAAALVTRETPKAAESVVRTCDQLAAEYLDFKRAKGKRSVGGDELALTRRILPWFGKETPVAEITALRIAQYDRERSAGLSRLKRAVTPATVNRELALLRHMLRLAEEWGYIAKAPRIRLGKESEGRLRFLSSDEAVRLLKVCGESQNPYLRAIVTVGLHTGMRRGEILGLSWERVDFARGVLLVDRTKSGRRREIPMNRAVYDALEPLGAEARRALPDPAPGERRAELGGLIFRKASGAAWGSIRTAFEKACSDAKVLDFRFHDLRHTCASWLVIENVW
jgi:integrase